MNVLLIDDDFNLSKVLSYQLEKNGYTVVTANSGREGLRLFEKQDFDIVLTDIRMPDISGIQVLQEIRKQNPQIIIIMITAYGSVENALEACRLGADDYITKPFGQEQLLFVIEKALRFRQLQQENIQLREELESRFQFGNMIVKSAAMENVIRIASRVAQSDATVLLLGESGTGKELLAKAIHYNSSRKDKPLITVNCPSIPDNLLESELFGHTRGAFTGAIKDRKGKFQLADGGSIFLDEIGDLGENVQAKLLRVLQEHEIERLGDSTPIQVDVRVIAATNKNLKQLMKEGRFREDLYYRLSVIPITIPPLRERKEEIPYLVEHFVQKFSKGRRILLDKNVLEIFQKYHWPGNVRELENAIEHATVLADSNTLTAEHLPSYLAHLAVREMPLVSEKSPETLSLMQIEARAIRQALQATGGNQTRAAELLKIPRHVLLYRMKKLGIRAR
ncbi:MAG: sigma-54 dependent transcriptional regulator [Calditrichia bacterium]